MNKINKFRCINSKGVYNITEGKEYESLGVVYNCNVRYIYVCNDIGDKHSYYAMDRFEAVSYDIIYLKKISDTNMNREFNNDIPIILGDILHSHRIKESLDIGMKFDKSEYVIAKDMKTGNYILTYTKYKYDGGVDIVIEESDYKEFVKRMKILVYGILRAELKSDYWKNTYKNYIDTNINNEYIIDMLYDIIHD